MSISKTLLNQYRRQNQSSKYSVESLNDLSSFEVSEDCAVALINIQRDNSYSYEHWNNKVLNAYNEAVLMAHLSLEPLRDRNRKKKMIADMRRRSFSIEQCDQVIAIMSMEGVKEFGAKMWNLAVKGWEKILELLAMFKRWLGRVVRAPFTIPQNKLYDQYKGSKISDVLSKLPAGEKRKLLPYTITFSEVKDLVNKSKEGIKQLEFTNIYQSITADTITKIVTGKEPEEKKKLRIDIGSIVLTVGEGEDTPQEIINKAFFKEKKVPKQKEVEIKNILSSDSLEACSKDFLNDLDKVNQIADSIMREIGKMIKALKNKEKKDAGDPKNMSQEEKDALRKKMKDLNQKRSACIVFVAYLRALVNACFSFRSTVYRAAKSAIAIAEKKPEDKK